MVNALVEATPISGPAKVYKTESDSRAIELPFTFKIDKILANKVPFEEVAQYYLDFSIYFANLLFPLFLFLSVIWFTSKLANNTEVIAFLSSGVSFWRFF